MISRGKENSWRIIGIAGKDAKSQTTQSGMTIISFPVATIQGFKDDDVLWVNCVVFVSGNQSNSNFSKKLQEIAEEVKKGDRIMIEGYAQLKTYQKKDGDKGVDLSIVATALMPISQKKSEGDSKEEEIAF